MKILGLSIPVVKLRVGDTVRRSTLKGWQTVTKVQKPNRKEGFREVAFDGAGHDRLDLSSLVFKRKK